VSPAFQPLGQEYEPFLYALVSDESNGAPLTMLSVIARSGADPWVEAVRISHLPKDVALRVLTRMIEDSGGVEATPNRLETSIRLLALLSGRARPTALSAEADDGGAPILAILVLFAGLLLATLLSTLSYPATEAKNADRIGASSELANKQVTASRNAISLGDRRD
jgi:hypothetical protein